MKKICLLFATFLFASVTFAVNPIPSYYTPIQGATTFTEIAQKINPITDERRDMDIESPNPSMNPGYVASVYVFRLDGTKSIGPLSLSPGGSLIVHIDSKPWGVMINSPEPMIVSVFITSPTAYNQTEQNYLNYCNSADAWGFNNII